MVLVVVNKCLGSSQIPGLANEQACQREFGTGIIHSVDLAVGVSRDPQRGTDSLTCKNLGIDVDLAAVPQLVPCKESRGKGGVQFTVRLEAIRPLVGRVESPVCLWNGGSLDVEIPLFVVIGGILVITLSLCTDSSHHESCEQNRHGIVKVCCASATNHRPKSSYPKAPGPRGSAEWRGVLARMVCGCAVPLCGKAGPFQTVIYSWLFPSRPHLAGPSSDPSPEDLL